MDVPGADELAAIASAYLALSARDAAPAPAKASRWRLAARLPELDAQRARSAARSTSRWNAAGRLDD